MNGSQSPVSMSADYLVTMIAGEAALAELLGHYKVHVPQALTPSTLLYPTLRGANGRLSPFPLPRWRRDWSAAGDLITRCGLSIIQRKLDVTVSTPFCESAFAAYKDHPSMDAAIRAAMVQAARAHMVWASAAPKDATC